MLIIPFDQCLPRDICSTTLSSVSVCFCRRDLNLVCNENNTRFVQLMLSQAKIIILFATHVYADCLITDWRHKAMMRLWEGKRMVKQASCWQERRSHSCFLSMFLKATVPCPCLYTSIARWSLTTGCGWRGRGHKGRYSHGGMWRVSAQGVRSLDTHTTSLLAFSPLYTGICSRSWRWFVRFVLLALSGERFAECALRK